MGRGNRETEQIIPGLYALSVGASDMPTPDGWRWVKLTDIARLESGHTPSRQHPEYWDGDVPWVGIKDARLHHGGIIHTTLQTITEDGLANSAARWLPAGTVCLSRTASVGYVTMLGRPMATSQDFVNWICSSAIDPKFLMNLILAEGDHILRFGKGSTHTTIYFPEVQAFHICIPPILQQHRIISKIESLTARSRRAKEALDAIPALLERFRQSVLAAAFRGDLTADWRDENPDVEPAEELLRQIRAERRRRWEEAELAKMRAKGKVPGDDRWKEKYEEPTPVAASELPELPEGWCWASIGELAEVGTGTTPSRSVPSYYGGGIPWVTSGALNQWLVGSTDETVTEKALREASLTLYPPHTLLVAMYGEGKTRGKVSELMIEAATNQAIAAIVMRESASLARPYIKLALLKSYEDIRLVSSGGVQPNLNLDKVRSIAVPIAPLQEMQEIERRVQSYMTACEVVKNHAVDVSADVALLDRAILAKAFRGELVPQNPNDEPASVLLERLRAEREQSGKTTSGAGRRRAPASPSPVQSDPTVPGRKPHASRRSQAPARPRG